jgi:hypothetical protein
MRQRTQLINALRAHLAELGIVAAQGREGVKELLKIIASEQDARLPVDAHASLVVLAAGLQALQTMIGLIELLSIARTKQASGSGASLGLALWVRPPSPPLSRTRRFFDRVATLEPGSGSYRGKIRLAARRRRRAGRRRTGCPDRAGRKQGDRKRLGLHQHVDQRRHRALGEREVRSTAASISSSAARMVPWMTTVTMSSIGVFTG